MVTITEHEEVEVSADCHRTAPSMTAGNASLVGAVGVHLLFLREQMSHNPYPIRLRTGSRDHIYRKKLQEIDDFIDNDCLAPHYKFCFTSKFDYKRTKNHINRIKGQ
jgi:hypothetical protein